MNIYRVDRGTYSKSAQNLALVTSVADKRRFLAGVLETLTCNSFCTLVSKSQHSHTFVADPRRLIDRGHEGAVSSGNAVKENSALARQRGEWPK